MGLSDPSLTRLRQDGNLILHIIIHYCSVSFAHVVIIVAVTSVCLACTDCCLPSGFAIKSSKLLHAPFSTISQFCCCRSSAAATRQLQHCCYNAAAATLLLLLRQLLKFVAALAAVDNTSAVEVECRFSSSPLLFAWNLTPKIMPASSDSISRVQHEIIRRATGRFHKIHNLLIWERTHIT